jgi:hypothetical protein
MTLVTISACASSRWNERQPDAVPSAAQESEEEKKQRIDSDYKEFIKSNKCDTARWSSYEYGAYFQMLGDIFKITPYDIVFGDAYTVRKIKSDNLSEAKSNYFKYVNHHMPKPIQDKFFEIIGQREVFNLSIKRDYECYLKLK